MKSNSLERRHTHRDDACVRAGDACNAAHKQVVESGKCPDSDFVGVEREGLCLAGAW